MLTSPLVIKQTQIKPSKVVNIKDQNIIFNSSF